MKKNDVEKLTGSNEKTLEKETDSTTTDSKDPSMTDDGVDTLEKKIKSIKIDRKKTRDRIKKMNNAVYTLEYKGPISNVDNDGNTQPLFDFTNPHDPETIIGKMLSIKDHCIWYQHSTKQSTSEEGMLKHDSISTYNMMVAHAVFLKLLREKGVDTVTFMYAGFDPSMALQSNAEGIFNNFLGAKIKKEIPLDDLKLYAKRLTARIVHRKNTAKLHEANIQRKIENLQKKQDEETDPDRKKALGRRIHTEKRILVRSKELETTFNEESSKPKSYKDKILTKDELQTLMRKRGNTHTKGKRKGNNTGTNKGHGTHPRGNTNGHRNMQQRGRR